MEEVVPAADSASPPARGPPAGRHVTAGGSLIGPGCQLKVPGGRSGPGRPAAPPAGQTAACRPSAGDAAERRGDGLVRVWISSFTH